MTTGKPAAYGVRLFESKLESKPKTKACDLSTGM